MVTPLFELRGVSFSAGGKEIMHPLDLTLEDGRIHALIGPNGSGKSTLIRLLAGQTAPTTGEARFLGAPLRAAGSRALARSLAYLPQFPPAAEGMTVAELVALGRYPWHGAFGRATDDDRARTEDALARTGVARFRDRLVDSLSGGERQRVWLAMLLAQDTRCLLLDEPTSALDIAHQAEMLTLVEALSRERGLGVVIVLHDVNGAARHCDRIVALGEGRVIADGPPSAIMRPEILRAIYGVAMDILPHPRSGEPVACLA